jgi:hypothetical protein
MNGQIFISYRREESRWSARSLYNRLIRHFDRKQIFMDLDTVAPGDDFVVGVPIYLASRGTRSPSPRCRHQADVENSAAVFSTTTSLDHISNLSNRR